MKHHKDRAAHHNPQNNNRNDQQPNSKQAYQANKSNNPSDPNEDDFLEKKKSWFAFLHELDALLQHCQHYLNSAKEAINNARATKGGGDSRGRTESGSFLSVLNLSHKLTHWREKRKGEKLFHQFDSANCQLNEAEEKLKTLTDENLLECIDLVEKLSQLRKTLQACVYTNQVKVDELEVKVFQQQNLLSDVLNMEHSVSSMISFLDEINNQEEFSQPYIPWALRQHLSEHSDDEGIRDSTYISSPTPGDSPAETPATPTTSSTSDSRSSGGFIDIENPQSQSSSSLLCSPLSPLPTPQKTAMSKIKKEKLLGKLTKLQQVTFLCFLPIGYIIII